MIERKIIKELTSWCGDAWCAGDYFYSWQRFTYDQIKQQWSLQFVVFPHVSEGFLEETKHTLSDKENFLAAQKILAYRSVCYFFSPDPLEMIKIRDDGDDFTVLGISNKMRDALLSCNIAVEKLWMETL